MAGTQTEADPRRYFEHIGEERGAVAEAEPVCLYLETTNRCNLLCTTCPRTFEALEPPADMSWALFIQIVDQFPNIARVVLHGVGEPMMVRNLPRMIRHLKDRGTYVLFNTNGTLLTAKKGQELIDSGLDELRVSLDAAEPGAFKLVRGRDMFARIVRNVSSFRALQRDLGAERPRVSLWLTGLKETIDQLADFVRLAHDIDVPEVYLQRLVYFPEGQGLARPQSALFPTGQARGLKAHGGDDAEGRLIRAAEDLAERLGIAFNASGASDPATSLKPGGEAQPWSLCRRPWSLMYVTAHGRVLPCCIAPFSMRGYDAFTLGDATQETLRDIWNGDRYQAFRGALLSDKPPVACAGCGLRWSL
jgi:MoaA/NifB/PqqE/SkfB family radical SAM enzyme